MVASKDGDGRAGNHCFCVRRHGGAGNRAAWQDARRGRRGWWVVALVQGPGTRQARDAGGSLGVRPRAERGSGTWPVLLRLPGWICNMRHRGRGAAAQARRAATASGHCKKIAPAAALCRALEQAHAVPAVAAVSRTPQTCRGVPSAARVIPACRCMRLCCRLADDLAERTSTRILARPRGLRRVLAPRAPRRPSPWSSASALSAQRLPARCVCGSPLPRLAYRPGSCHIHQHFGWVWLALDHHMHPLARPELRVETSP